MCILELTSSYSLPVLLPKCKNMFANKAELNMLINPSLLSQFELPSNCLSLWMSELKGPIPCYRSL